MHALGFIPSARLELLGLLPDLRDEYLRLQALLTAQKYGFEETVSVIELVERWNGAARAWRKIRRGVRRDPGYLAEGVLAYPTPTSQVW